MSWLELISWGLIAGFMFVRALVSVSVAMGDHMQREHAEPKELPALWPIYVRHILAFFFKRRAFGPKHRLKKISITVKEGNFRPELLREYNMRSLRIPVCTYSSPGVLGMSPPVLSFLWTS